MVRTLILTLTLAGCSISPVVEYTNPVSPMSRNLWPTPTDRPVELIISDNTREHGCYSPLGCTKVEKDKILVVVQDVRGIGCHEALHVVFGLEHDNRVASVASECSRAMRVIDEIEKRSPELADFIRREK